MNVWSWLTESIRNACHQGLQLFLEDLKAGKAPLPALPAPPPELASRT